jgi:hypothetical protein
MTMTIPHRLEGIEPVVGDFALPPKRHIRD